MGQVIISAVGLPIAYGLIVVILFVAFVALPISTFVWWRDQRKGTYEKKVNKIRRNDPWKKSANL